VTTRSYELDAIRADGWFERVVESVPALGRLCEGLGEALVAMSLVAGFRIVSAAVDRTSGEVTNLQWVRDTGSGESADGGNADALRTEVMGVLLGEADDDVALSEDPSAEELRECIGARVVLLAPLFGLALQRLDVAQDASEHRLVVAHEQGQESVPLRQFRRFLRSRVVDALQQQRSRSVAIDLEQAEVAHADFAAGRHEAVVTRLGPWVSPLLMYLRTPEGAALDLKIRADLARALGGALHALGRVEEAEETLRLAVQYAHDGAAAPELYRTLAKMLVATGRRGESIGLIRRALSLDPESQELLPDLALGYIAAGRAVAAVGVLTDMRASNASAASCQEVEEVLRERLGESYTRWSRHVS
jgi:tetratricopeptide (TPR) repeat protein